MGGVREVELGEHKYPVFPQKVGYLIHKLGPRLQEALEAEIAGVDGAAMIGVKAHDVLSVFIPQLMPVHEFLGFASEEALRSGDYDEKFDKSPDAPQIEAAFTAAKEVNGGQVLDHLKALVGAMAPEMKEKALAFVTAKMAESFRSPISAPSPTSPSTSGASPSANSSTSPQTPAPTTA